jgi:isopentenyl-diphosphate delta-isomerase
LYAVNNEERSATAAEGPAIPAESPIEQRKREHVELASGGTLADRGSAGFDDVRLVHDAVPETSPARVDVAAQLFGRSLRLPLVIAAMTGGFAGGAEINARLAAAAERHGIAMGVGSQRAALVEPGLAHTYGVVREVAPSALLIANIGVAQLVRQRDRPALELDEVERLVEMIRANALAVHLNALQELVQPEGQPDARGWLGAIERLTAGLSVPVIAKETGSGMTADVARRLRDAGVAALDVGGRGGTSFAAIEAARARTVGDARGTALGSAFDEWGIPTLVSVALTAAVGLPVIATGGVRTGVDAAKAIAVGATAVGVARPLLQAALDGGDEALDAWIAQFELELRAATALTGSNDLGALRSTQRVILGETRQWLKQLEGHRVDG